jgi:hypothetical protein
MCVCVLYFLSMACHAAVFLRDPSSSVHLYLTSRLSQLYDFGADIVNQRIEYVEKETGESLDLLSEEEIARIKKKKEEDGVLGRFNRMWNGQVGEPIL